MLTSSVCPSIWQLSDFDKPQAHVAPVGNPMRISLIVAFGYRRVSLKYKRHAHGMSNCIRNDNASTWPTISVLLCVAVAEMASGLFGVVYIEG